MGQCQGQTKDGRACSRMVKAEALYCWQHEPDEAEPWREVYERLEKATPEERTEIVLSLIEAHPEGRLELPEREGIRANLQGIDLSHDMLKVRRGQLPDRPPAWWDGGFKAWRLLVQPGDGPPAWWDNDIQGADLFEANLQGADLSGANLHRAILAAANLQGADLSEANLHEARLGNANLQGTVLYKANLQEANLGGANLQRAILAAVNLQGADLSEVDLQGANLRYANLQGANLEEANLQEALLPEANLQEANLRNADLRGVYLNADLRRAKLPNADLRGVHLEGFNLQEADLEEANLQGANLRNANLQEANLGGAKLQGAKLWDADLRGANLSKANLHETDLWNADLRGAKLPNADLRGVYLGGFNLQGADLGSTKLQGANLRDADLSEAFLVYADLQEANLSKANLQRALLAAANLQGADLSEANLQGAGLGSVKLQGVDLLRCESIAHIYIGNAWLDHTRLRKEQLGGAIGEELAAGNRALTAKERAERYTAAKYAYLALKQNFDDLGDYDGSSWAYRKERRMEKMEAREAARAAFLERRWREVIVQGKQYVGDLIVEVVSDYGEGFGRVLGWIVAFILVIGPALFWTVGRFEWAEGSRDYYFSRTYRWEQHVYTYYQLLLYTIDTFTTANFAELRPTNAAARLISGGLAMIGIFLVGLLGFVAGNRIRRS